jgi:hypothetical protein
LERFEIGVRDILGPCGTVGISLEQVRAAVAYIDEHKAGVMATQRQIEDRIARGNPPEIKAKLAATRAKLESWLEQRQASEQESGSARNPGGR